MQQQRQAAEASQKCIQQRIDKKKQEAKQKQEKRKAALKEKVNRQNKEREEKECVNRLIRKQKQLEYSNAAIIAQMAASDAETERMQEVLRQMRMGEEDDNMEVQVMEEEVAAGATATTSNINKPLLGPLLWCFFVKLQQF